MQPFAKKEQALIAIDTNVLVRVLTDDEESPEQTQLARAFIAVESQHAHLTLWTFDRKLSKQEGEKHLQIEALAKFQTDDE